MRSPRQPIDVRELDCLWGECELLATETVWPFDGLHPTTMHLCHEHVAVAKWLGLTMPAPCEPAGERHWLDDEAPAGERVATPWRVVEWGLAGQGRPRATRAAVRDESRETEVAGDMAAQVAVSDVAADSQEQLAL